jgi:hypothetical protein
MPVDPRIPIELHIDAAAPPGQLASAIAALLLARARHAVATKRANEQRGGKTSGGTGA